MTAKRIVLIAIVLSTTARAESPQPQPAEKEAIEAAQNWLSLLDAGQYERAWEAGAEMMKRDMPKARLRDLTDAWRKQAGPVRSRKLSRAGHASPPRGFPAGTYVSVKYETVFNDPKPVIEWVMLSKERDGIWRPLGYQLELHAGDSPSAETTSKTSPDTALVDGSLSKAAVQQTIRKHFGQVRRCYEKELLRRPALAEVEGRIEVRFTVAPSGRVNTVLRTENTLGDERVDACLCDHINAWVFPKADGETIVVYPFVFKTSQ